MARHINQAGLKLLMASEGCRLNAYPDPGTGNEPYTIGFGHCGPEVKPGLTITQAEADDILVKDVQRFERAVDELIKVEISVNAFSAVVCFTFNCGVQALKRSTLLKLINQNDMAGAARQFGLWTKAGKRVLPGLVMRRRAESLLFQRPDRG
jgi:lysozyme